MQYALSRDPRLERGIIKPIQVLEQASHASATLFLNVYRCLEDRGLVPSPQQKSESSVPGMARLMSLYLELWSTQLELTHMEHLA
jgi:hypothetical protein